MYDCTIVRTPRSISSVGSRKDPPQSAAACATRSLSHSPDSVTKLRLPGADPQSALARKAWLGISQPNATHFWGVRARQSLPLKSCLNKLHFEGTLPSSHQPLICIQVSYAILCQGSSAAYKSPSPCVTIVHHSSGRNSAFISCFTSYFLLHESSSCLVALGRHDWRERETSALVQGWVWPASPQLHTVIFFWCQG